MGKEPGCQDAKKICVTGIKAILSNSGRVARSLTGVAAAAAAAAPRIRLLRTLVLERLNGHSGAGAFAAEPFGAGDFAAEPFGLERFARREGLRAWRSGETPSQATRRGDWSGGLPFSCRVAA
jgi:hypothetical protein